MARIWAAIGFICLASWVALAGLFASLTPLSAQTQTRTTGVLAADESNPVSVVADRIDFDPVTGVLRANGNVQVFRGTEVLSTDVLIYDQRAKRLTVPGPMTLADGTQVVIRADGAVLDDNLTNGLIRGAEVLIAQQMQIAAARAHRKDGRYSVLDKAVATTCHVCADNPVPFWKIRARRVIQDEKARRLYFENATLDVLGVPIFYTPRLRVPDPSVNRATGFLVPRFSRSSLLGYGFSIPYYVVVSDQVDFTITPRVFSTGAALLYAQYRQRVRRGQFEIEGYVTVSDDLAPRATRSSLTASGLFELDREIELEFGIDLASDKSVRDDYDIGDDEEDRLTSFIELRRTRKNTFASISARRFQSLRTNEIDQEIPLVLPEVYARKTWNDRFSGGKFGLTANAVSLLREDDSRFSRIGIGADWTRDWIWSSGLITQAYAGVEANTYYTRAYPGFTNGSQSEVIPTAALDFRLPLARSESRVTHLIEPRIQIVWSPNGTRSNPNEDSTQLEFEETNLFSLNRFPGFDRSERGLRANVGLTYKRIDPAGWSWGVTAGRVFRQRDLGQFGAGTGLAGKQSDYVTAITFNYLDKVDFINRTLFDDGFDVSKNEARLRLNFERFSTEAAYVWLEQNVVAGASDRTHEASIALEYRRNDYLTYIGSWRQNLETGNSISGEFGIRYENECVAVNLSYSLQFEGLGIVRPTREFGLTVELAGLGNKKRNRRYANRCTLL
ncbi:MAG: LPS assembly protein LptD [Pseudomonadota bacterium]